MRYRIFDAGRRNWLAHVVTMATDDGAGMIVGVIWTNDPANAMAFQGVKGAARMIERLGGWDELCITNGRGAKVK